MAIALTILAMSVGVLIGLISVDLVQRKADREAIASHKTELKAEAEKLAALHNQTAEQFRHVADKVSAHEMIIKSGKAKGTGSGF